MLIDWVGVVSPNRVLLDVALAVSSVDKAQGGVTIIHSNLLFSERGEEEVILWFLEDYLVVVRGVNYVDEEQRVIVQVSKRVKDVNGETELGVTLFTAENLNLVPHGLIRFIERYGVDIFFNIRGDEMISRHLKRILKLVC